MVVLVKGRQIFFFSLYSVLILLAGCGKEQKKVVQVLVDEQEVVLYQAKNEDIPVPVGFTCTHLESGSAGTDGAADHCCYNGKQSVDAVVAFLEKRLEQTGWIVNEMTTNLRGVFYCCKKNRQLVLVVQPAAAQQKLTTLDVYVQQYREHQDENGLLLEKINAKMLYADSAPTVSTTLNGIIEEYRGQGLDSQTLGENVC